MNTIQVYLEKLGLSEIESKIYLGLIELKSATVLDLAKKLKIKRATVHFNVENLIQKGLANQVKYGARRQIVPEPPENLANIIQDKIADLHNLKADITSITADINKLIPANQKDNAIEVKYFDGKKAIRLIYDDIMKAKDIRTYFHASEVRKIFPDNIESLIEAQNKIKDMRIKDIMDRSVQNLYYANEMNPERYEYKFYTGHMEFKDSHIIMYDGKVANINLHDNTSGFVIYNQDYYDNMSAIFDFVWKTLPTQQL